MTEKKTPFMLRFSRQHRTAYDLMALLVYLILVHAWGLGIHALGRDYPILAGREPLPFLLRTLLEAEKTLFGVWAPGYHVVNLVLLYGCMVGLYFFIRVAAQGPSWLGTLGAALFMANTVHSEAVLNLTGPVDLLPALWAFGALAAYAQWRKPGDAAPASGYGKLWFIPALAFFAVASVPHQRNVFLILVIALYEWLVVGRERRRIVPTLPFILVTVAALFLHRDIIHLERLDPARMFGPLYFIFYPIGFLPETARRFYENPWLGWASAAAIVCIAALVYRKVRRPALLLGLLGMLAVRLFQDQFVDPVHLVGGGRLLVANGLFNLALVIVFHSMMRHPKWRRPVVVMTTVLALIFFGLQIASIRAWSYAGDKVQAFQKDAAAAASSRDALGVLPDYQYFRGAPLCLSKSVSHDTPFSRAVRHVSILPLHYDKPNEMQVDVRDWSSEGGAVVVRGKSPVEVIPWPYTLRDDETGLPSLVEEGDDFFIISIRPRVEPYPYRIITVTPQSGSAERQFGRIPACFQAELLFGGPRSISGSWISSGGTSTTCPSRHTQIDLPIRLCRSNAAATPLRMPRSMISRSFLLSSRVIVGSSLG